MDELDESMVSSIVRALVEEERKRAEKAEAERAFFEGYAADLQCIDRVLDQYNAPHDCEEGVSLAPKRIRLLAERAEKAEAELASVWSALERWQRGEQIESDYLSRADFAELARVNAEIRKGE